MTCAYGKCTWCVRKAAPPLDDALSHGRKTGTVTYSSRGAVRLDAGRRLLGSLSSPAAGPGGPALHQAAKGFAEGFAKGFANGLLTGARRP